MPSPGANTTDLTAHDIHGKDPQLLIEKITRTKIRECNFWKQHCFALTAESLVDKGVELKSVGGTYGGSRKPTEFMCLILKMLQIAPEKDIVVAFIKNPDHKYIRLLGAFYLRLTGKPMEIYRYLEMCLMDFRRVRIRLPTGKYEIKHMDELIDGILRNDYYFDIALPRLPARLTLEVTRQLPERQSGLEELVDDDEDTSGSEEEDAPETKAKSKGPKSKPSKASRSRSRERESSPKKERKRSESPEKDSFEAELQKHKKRSKKSRRSRSSSSSRGRSESPRERSRSRSRSRSRGRRRKRSRSRSRDRRRARSESRSRSRDRNRKKDKKKKKSRRRSRSRS